MHHPALIEHLKKLNGQLFLTHLSIFNLALYQDSCGIISALPI